jgi:hypothetical protein
MKWTKDMNITIMRGYYRATKLETDLTDYRIQTHTAFTDAYPDIADRVTVQRIADQRRQIVTKRWLTEEELQKIKEEVALEIPAQEVQEDAVEEVLLLDTQESDDTIIYDIEEEIVDNNIITEAEDALKTAIEQYDGFAIESRPTIPRLRTGKRAREYTRAVNECIKQYVGERKDLTAINNLVYCAAAATTALCGQKLKPVTTKTHNKGQAKPKWQLRLQERIDGKRKVIGRLTQYVQGNSSKRLCQSLKDVFSVVGTKKKDQDHMSKLNSHLDTLKQTVQALAQRLRRYTTQAQRQTQNQMFNTNEKQFYRNLNKNANAEGKASPEMSEVTKYWSNIWSVPKQHNQDADWLPEIKSETMNIPRMSKVTITQEDMKAALTKSHNWKAAGIDKIQNYWYKQFTSVHEALTLAYNEVLENKNPLPSFLTRGITYLLPKSDNTEDPSKYRPITCLSTMYKILTSIIASKIYEHIEQNSVMSEEQKGCIKRAMGCKEQLTIDNIVTREIQKKLKDMVAGYVDYKKAYDSTAHTWLLEVLEIYKIDIDLIVTLGTLMSAWETVLHVYTGGELQVSNPIKINRGIFQGDSLSPIWFCLALNPLSTLLNKLEGLKIGIQDKIYNLTHLLYVDDLKLYARNKRKLDKLLDKTAEFSKDIAMEFGVDKCAILSLKKGKFSEDSGYALNEGYIKAMENGETYKYLGFKQAHKNNHTEIKTELKRALTKQIITIMKTELNGKNKIKAINTWAIPLLTYSFGILNWARTDLESI